MRPFDHTPPQAALPRANENAEDHTDNAMPPEYPGAPDGLPLIPVQEFADNLPGEMPEEAADHLPDFFI